MLPRIQTFAVNSLNDLYVDMNGNIALAFDIDAVLQDCEHVMNTRLGELVLQTNLGLPYLTAVFTGIPNIPLFEAASRTALLSVTGVVELIEFNAIQQPQFIAGSTRTQTALVYTAIIRTVYGVGTIGGQGIFNG